MLSTAKIDTLMKNKPLVFSTLLALVLTNSATSNAAPPAKAQPTKKTQDALLLRAQQTIKQGDDYLPKALEYINQALKLDDKYPQAHFQKAQVLFDMQEDDATALKEVNQALTLTQGQKPTFVGYLYLKANILRRLARNVEALAVFDSYQNLDSDPIASNLKARIEVDLGKLKEAEKTLTASLAHHATWVDTHAARAQIRMKLKDYKGVVADTQAVEKANFKDGLAIARTALINQAEALYQLHDIAAMNEALKKVLKRFPDDRPSLAKAIELYKATGNKAEYENAAKKMQLLEKDLGL